MTLFPGKHWGPNYLKNKRCTDKKAAQERAYLAERAKHTGEERMKGDIHTSYLYPPIPDRQFDWCAVRDGYEPGAPQGFGETEREAINDLLDLEDERE